ncbi:protein LIFEGUARD 2-like [Zingiber officinale]|uniref:protein LIFEGUARD 2-like n=1 Tax=Zingiber officinale TaxID=94328 RepID=UPI001C4AE6B4|nr:protein LIFEGUARD 2-like [Zingiber officinale]
MSELNPTLGICEEMRPQYEKGADLEVGRLRTLSSNMTKSPELRYVFIKKVYFILTLQLALTVAVAIMVILVKLVSHIFVSSGAGLARLGVYICLSILPLIFLCPLCYIYQERHFNFLLLGLFTVSTSFAVGMTRASTNGKVILEAAILTAVVVLSLTLYTFWAARRGHDLNFLGPFLFAALWVVLVFALIQILFPLGKLSTMIYGGPAAMVFSDYIVYETNNLIKLYSYDLYIWAAISLYLDILNLFLSLLTLFRAADS